MPQPLSGQVHQEELLAAFPLKLEDARIGVVGLGYVGLPIAVALGQQFPTIGIDINASRIEKLKLGHDATRETSAEDLETATHLTFTAEWAEVAACNIYIVTVPTPLDGHNHPDLGPLESATCAIGHVLKRGDLVIYESTVYPGCTEEFCVPILEDIAGLTCNRDFFCGYSPERINPGDKDHKIGDIMKITSGSTPEAAEFVDQLYRRIITAGTHRASSIRVAEAAKVMENTQRDLNIALANELAMICNALGIDTIEVLEAAGTKWNFMPVRPGLVGGHCIGVDPYYLTYKAEEISYHPEVILAGRRINDRVGKYIVNQFVRLMGRKGLLGGNPRVLVLGFAFKENCPDHRNTKVANIVSHLREFDLAVDVYDPWVDAAQCAEEYGIRPVTVLETGKYDGIILAVAHEEFLALGASGIRALGKPGAALYDVKSVLPKGSSDQRL
ncbi:nucleotide sugar dehydrogenase [Croceibacterium sp. LX-88]|uniref:Nucleotide sugar dehydrogenase n=1 Tax=Croceibacterium selenioxidans TaxID=2838833 RepID=A0ABS5W5A6_9SPHN|nr:nucleotide sugar dehydrogenase [Croceibacterium selenioxidans]MBT2134512.1 nucleotide sugar dehydrogenase [Croceibacterium selenioxidans]